MVFDKMSMVEARGFSPSLVDIYLSRDASLIRATCKKTLKDDSNGIKSYVRYLDNQLKVIVETSFFNLDDDFENYLLDKKVSLLMDDLIIDYAINKDTKINRNTGFTKSHYGESVIEGNTFVRFDVDTKEFSKIDLELNTFFAAVSIGKEVTLIKKDAFKNINGILINYQGNVKDWLKIKLEEGSIGNNVLVRCLDGTVEYVNVDHFQKETRKLYYGYAHMGNQYRYSLQFAINRANIWEFIMFSHKSIIAWDYFCGAPYEAYDFDDPVREEYCILDYHNFKMVYLCDAEAG